MYCQQCQTLAPDNSTYCSQCGGKLTPTDQIDAKIAYFAKLIQSLANGGFRTDPRLLKEGGDTGMKETLKAVALFPLPSLPFLDNVADVFLEPVSKGLNKLTATDGERLVEQLDPIAGSLKLVAFKQFMMNLCVFAAIEADQLTLAQAEKRAAALCDAIYNAIPTHKTPVGEIPTSPKQFLFQHESNVFCLYVFFDEKRAQKMTDSILKKCKKARNNHLARYTAAVFPLVANVPARDLKTSRMVGLSLRMGPYTALTRQMLVVAFP